MVSAATLTKPCTAPKRCSQASTMAAGASGSPMSANTKVVGVPFWLSSRTRRTALVETLLPVSASPVAPSVANFRATASPSPGYRR